MASQESPFDFVPDLAGHVQPPNQGILSVSIAQSSACKAILFGFAAGEELSEHTAAVPALVQQISGKARWVIGGQEMAASPGSWARMEAKLPHSIHAETECVLLLLLLSKPLESKETVKA